MFSTSDLRNRLASAYIVTLYLEYPSKIRPSAKPELHMLQLAALALLIRWLWPCLLVLVWLVVLPLLYLVMWFEQHAHIVGPILLLSGLLGVFLWACRANFESDTVKEESQYRKPSWQPDSTREFERQQHKNRMAVYRAEALAEIERLRKKSPDFRKSD